MFSDCLWNHDLCHEQCVVFVGLALVVSATRWIRELLIVFRLSHTNHDAIFSKRFSGGNSYVVPAET